MTLIELEAKIQILEDIEAIKKLQNAYCFYLQHWQEEEIVDLFSRSPDTVIDMGLYGRYKGMEGVKTFFSYSVHYKVQITKAPPEFLHQLMPLSGIIDIGQDGKSAKGRWYGFGVYAIPMEGEVQALFGSGIWENEYIREDGKWKFKRLHYSSTFRSPYEDGWVKTPVWRKFLPKNNLEPPPNSVSTTYPSGYILPYHYKNPVTGK